MKKMILNLNKNKWKIQARTDLTGYLFITPNVVIFMLFMILPVLFSFFISFTDWDYAQGFDAIQFIGTENYEELIHDEWFIAAFWNTIKFVVGTVPLSIILGLIIAVIIERQVKGKPLARLLLFLPYLSNIVAVSTVWIMMYSPFGPITEFLKAIGINEPPNWLGSYDWALPGIIIMSIWLVLGYCVMIYSAAIQALPDDVYEAAMVDGATGIQSFLKITIPMLRPTTFFLVVTSIIGSFKVFGQINIMTNGGPGTSTNVLVYYIYKSAFSFFKMGYASAVSWVLFALIFIVTLIQWKMQKKYEQ